MCCLYMRHSRCELTKWLLLDPSCVSAPLHKTTTFSSRVEWWKPCRWIMEVLQVLLLPFILEERWDSHSVVNSNVAGIYLHKTNLFYPSQRRSYQTFSIAYTLERVKCAFMAQWAPNITLRFCSGKDKKPATLIGILTSLKWFASHYHWLLWLIEVRPRNFADKMMDEF